MADLGELVVKIVGDNAQFIKNIDDVQKRMEAVSNEFIQLGKDMTSFVTLPILGIGAAFVKTASDAEETNSKFDAVFKDQAESVRDWAEEFSDSVNRATIDNIGFLATIQDTLVPLGFARDAASEMSKSVVSLATDLASFNNLPTEQVVRDIQSAIVGNTETLRKYGVVANETAIKQEAINSGIWDGEGAITAEEKALAILNLTFKGTTDAQGDAVRTADSFANQIRGLEAATTDLATEFGTILLPALSDIVSNITGAIKWFADLDDGTKEFILTIAGVAAATGPLLIVFGNLAKTIAGVGTASSSLLGPLGLVVAGIVALNAAAGDRNLIFINAALQSAAKDSETWSKSLDDIVEKSGLTREEVIQIAEANENIRDFVIEQEKAQGEYNIQLEQTKLFMADNLEAAVAIADSLGFLGNSYDILIEKLRATNTANQELNDTMSGGGETGDDGSPIEKQIKDITSYADVVSMLKDEYRNLDDAATEAISNITDEITNGVIKQEQSMIDASATIERLTQEYIDMFNETEQRAEEMYGALEQWTGNYFDVLGEAIAKGKLDWETLKDALKQTIVALLKALARELFIRGLQLIALPIWLGGSNARGAALIAAAAAARLAAGVVAALEEGGIVEPRAGGTIARIGEGGSAEAVLPLRDDVMGRLADQITANMQPQTNIFNNTSTQFPSELTLMVEGQPIRAFITDSMRNGQIQVSPRAIASR